MKRHKITYIVSCIDKSLEFEWAAKYLSGKYELEFILINAKQNTTLSNYLNSVSVKNYFIKYRGKRDLFFAFVKVFLCLFRTKPDLINAHLFDATFIGLPAAFLCGIKQRLYTRHHSDLHHVYFPHAIKYDKLNNKLATHIIAVSETVKDILVQKEGVNPLKITVVPHGINIDEFKKPIDVKIESLKLKYNLKGFYPVIGVISRYTEWKGIHYIIPAFHKLLKNYPNACLVLANAKGDYAKEIHEELKAINRDHFREIEFEPDVASLYHCFDIFTHAPVSKTAEAFGQIYIEALAAGKACVCTLSGIANEILKDKQNAIIVDYRNSVSIENAYRLILENPELVKQLVTNGPQSVIEFTADKKFNSLALLYDRMLLK